MMPRVCLVAATAADNGKLLAAWLRGLLSAGWDAQVLCTRRQVIGSPLLGDPSLAPNVGLIRMRAWHPPPRWLLRHPGALRRYLQTEGETCAFDQRLLKLRPDLIHFHSARDARLAMRLKRILDCRVAVSLNAVRPDLDQPNLEALWSGADLLTFPDEAMRDRAIARGCPPEKAVVLRIPVGPNRATDGYNSKPRTLRMISAGPLTWEQGYEHSVHAVRLLLDNGVDCRYRILGDGDHLNAVGFARHQLDLAGRVELVRESEAPLEEALRASDVFVDPAVTAKAPAAPLALAHAVGVPFVATYRDGLPEDGGIKVRRRSAAEIAAAVTTLAGDPALRKRMGEVSRAHLCGYPTFEDHALRLEELYRRALSRN